MNTHHRPEHDYYRFKGRDRVTINSVHYKGITGLVDSVIRSVCLAQLTDRHEDALAAARAHSAIYFRKRAKWLRQLLA